MIDSNLKKINLISLADYNILVEIVKEQEIISHDEIENCKDGEKILKIWM